MARVRGAPDALLGELLYEPALTEDQHCVLPLLLRIDAAHVLMLAGCGLLAAPAAARLLALNHELGEQVRAGAAPWSGREPHRGLYWLYERHAIDRLGAEIGGAAHLARSRNDINATVARLRTRGELLALIDHLLALLETALGRAREHAATLMSCFTHLQPAQPSTLGHYLAGVASELLRSAHWLAAAFDAVNRSPMGAAAGAGTSFAIDREQVARHLGFSAVIDNAADAVASRDYLVQTLAAAAMAGSTLTRLAADLQLWASHAYGFVGWPDELVSTSSIMPQKRNAFALENIRGQAVRPAAALANVLLALKSTPFSNGVEVSTEATAPAWPALAAAGKAVRLTTLLLARMEVFPARMGAFLRGAETTMTALADYLVARHGLPFRSAHEAVGDALRELAAPPGPTSGRAPAVEALCARLESLTAAGAHPLRLDRVEVASVLDPARCLESARHGGGPAPAAVRRHLRTLAKEVAALRERTAGWRRALADADRRLDEAAAAARLAAPAALAPR